MLSLFTGKISGVLSLALQGITQTVGLLLDTVLDTVDTVLASITELTAPLTAALTQLPVVGDSIELVLDTTNDLIDTVGSGLHAVADQFLQGDLLGGVDTALNGVTTVAGQVLNDVADLLDHTVDLTAPVTHLLSDLPLISDVLDAVGTTTGNLIDTVAETGDYVAGIQPLDLVENLLNDPLATVGSTLQDGAGTIDALLDDLVPVTDLASGLPIVGDVITLIGESTTNLTQGIYDLGSAVSQINLQDPLNTAMSYV